jgi:nucleoside-diphosphate-sugar epimerase
MKRVLVTGATGFVGHALCQTLAERGYTVRAALRSPRSVPPYVLETTVVGEIDENSDWTRALDGVDAIFHLAALAHAVGNIGANDDAYFKTNASGTQQLASAAGRAGVRRFVYLSSIKVNGEETTEPYRPADEPQPTNAYARSKWMGEQYVSEAASKTGIEAVIVRPPLIYGPGVRANFLRLMQWVDRELPLPLGAVQNKRSLVGIWNLTDFLLQVLESRTASGRTWLVSDGADLSTPELIRALGFAMKRTVKLVPIPPMLLRVAGHAVGRGAEVDRLCGSLTVDISSTLQQLDWSPPMSVEQAISNTVAWYRLNQWR